MTVTNTGCKITHSITAEGYSDVILEMKNLTSFTHTGCAASEENELYMI